jgi:small subunit ribosomal protein S20
MAQHKSAKKRIITNEKARRRNQRFLQLMRKSIRKVRESENKDEAIELLNKAVSVVDRLASKGIIHRNRAAGHKSRLYKRVAKLG